jgi:Fe2+ transport system protein FeoA
VRISRILDQNPAFLQFIGRSGLTPGVTVTVQARDPLADSLSIRPAGSAPITLGSAAAAKILINPLA